MEAQFEDKVDSQKLQGDPVIGGPHTFVSTPEYSVLNKACPQRKLDNQILTCWDITRA